MYILLKIIIEGTSGGNNMVIKFSKLTKEKRVLKVIGIIVALVLLSVLIIFDLPINQSWSSWSLPLSGYIFVIDPGHGGPDGGAEGKDGTQEKYIALNVANYLKDYLNEAGAYVIMTRETDKDLAGTNTKGLSKRKLEDLQNRVRLANDSLADFYISIHLNSIPSTKWRGAQTFYYPVSIENKEMAESIQKQLISNLNNTSRTPLARNDILVLKYVEMPSVMVEAGFLSNPDELALLKSEEYQKKVAFAIYQGMLDYFAEKDTLLEDENKLGE